MFVLLTCSALRGPELRLTGIVQHVRRMHLGLTTTCVWKTRLKTEGYNYVCQFITSEHDALLAKSAWNDQFQRVICSWQFRDLCHTSYYLSQNG